MEVVRHEMWNQSFLKIRFHCTKGDMVLVSGNSILSMEIKIESVKAIDIKDGPLGVC